MNEVIRQVQSSGDPYDLLPEPLKVAYTRTEYLWLTDAEKTTLQQRETEPEY